MSTQLTLDLDAPAHAELSCSGSSTWLNCPGSVAAQKGIPDVGSVFAAEGTVAHTVAERILREAHGNLPYEDPEDATAEMVSHAEGYRDYVLGALDPDRGELHIEERVAVGPHHPEGFGTIDALIVSPREFRVVDYKFGQGERVDAERNSQLMLYGLGALHEYDWLYQPEEIVLCIYQPRLGHVDEWTISTEKLLAWGRDVVAPAVARTKDPSAPRIPGRAQCRWCRFKKNCTERHQQHVEDAKKVFETWEQADLVSPEELSEALGKCKDLKSWISDLESLAMHRLTSGEPVPEWKLVRGRGGRRTWLDPVRAKQYLKNIRLKIDQYAPRKLATPAQIEKLAPQFKDKIKPFTSSPVGKPTLAPVDDKRPAITDGGAAFEAVDEEGGDDWDE